MAWKGRKQDVAITSGAAQTVETVSIHEGASTFVVDISNQNHKALDAFQVQIGVSDAQLFTVASAASDYTTSIQWPLKGCSVDLTTLAKNTRGLLVMDVLGINQVRLKASSATGSDTNLDVYWRQR